MVESSGEHPGRAESQCKTEAGVVLRLSYLPTLQLDDGVFLMAMASKSLTKCSIELPGLRSSRRRTGCARDPR